jgi:hypothetical protein
MTTKTATKPTAKMEGKSTRKRTMAAAGTAKAANDAAEPSTTNGTEYLMARLATATGKHVVRLRKAVQALIDSGEQLAPAELAAQVEELVTNGAPEETKSTRRRNGPAKDDAPGTLLKQVRGADGQSVIINASDKAAIAEEAQSRLIGKVVKRSRKTKHEEAAEMEAEVRAVAALTGAPRIGHLEAAKAKPLAKEKPVGHLARGLDGHNAPHSTKAMADNRRDAKKVPGMAEAKEHLSGKVAKPAKAPKADRAAPKADDARNITVVDKQFTFGAEGTERRRSWDACVATAKRGAGTNTVAAYAAAGGKLKYLGRWAAAGKIKLG